MHHYAFHLGTRVPWRSPMPWAFRSITSLDETTHAPDGDLEGRSSRRSLLPTRHSVRVVIESELPCSADAAWAEVKTSRLLRNVCFPLVMFGRVDGRELPETWPAGETIECRSYLFGVIPLGLRRLHFERIDDAAREIQSRESDAIVARWDHLVRITPLGPDRCRYCDDVEIEAGWRTALVAWFARRLYHHRQRRWQAVARRLKAENTPA